jgi:hypothetical protein
MFSFLPPLPAPLPPHTTGLLLVPTFPLRGLLAAATLAALGFRVRRVPRARAPLAWSVTWRGRSLPFRSPATLALRLSRALRVGAALRG